MKTLPMKRAAPKRTWCAAPPGHARPTGARPAFPVSPAKSGIENPERGGLGWRSVIPDDEPSRAPAGRFTTTRWSVVLGAVSEDSVESRRALEVLYLGYRAPILAFVRRTGVGREAAEDLAQQFFALLLEKKWLTRVDRERGRFRGFLLAYLKRFLSDQRDRASAGKRGGGVETLSLDDFEGPEGVRDVASGARHPDHEFDRQWALTVLHNALQRLRAEAAATGALGVLDAVQGHLVPGNQDETLGSVAARCGMGESALKMRLHRWRQRYQDLIRAEVADTVPRQADVNEELRHLMAALAD